MKTNLAGLQWKMSAYLKLLIFKTEEEKKGHVHEYYCSESNSLHSIHIEWMCSGIHWSIRTTGWKQNTMIIDLILWWKRGHLSVCMRDVHVNLILKKKANGTDTPIHKRRNGNWCLGKETLTVSYCSGNQLKN